MDKEGNFNIFKSNLNEIRTLERSHHLERTKQVLDCCHDEGYPCDKEWMPQIRNLASKGFNLLFKLKPIEIPFSVNIPNKSIVYLYLKKIKREETGFNAGDSEGTVPIYFKFEIKEASMEQLECLKALDKSSWNATEFTYDKNRPEILEFVRLVTGYCPFRIGVCETPAENPTVPLGEQKTGSIVYAQQDSKGRTNPQTDWIFKYLPRVDPNVAAMKQDKSIPSEVLKD